jgi:hypothetical protein
MDAIVVNSVAEEYRYLRRQRCVCGDRYQLLFQLLRQQEERHFDELHARCEKCGAERDFLFDISSFFGQGIPNE